MGDMPEGEEEQDRPSAANRSLAWTSNNPCIRAPLRWAGGLVFGSVLIYLVLIPVQFLPDYIALPFTFALGMVLWGLLLGFRLKVTPKQKRRFWSMSALLWGGGVCLVYAESLRQRYHVLVGWYWLGLGLQVITGLTALGWYFADKDNSGKGKSQ